MLPQQSRTKTLMYQVGQKIKPALLLVSLSVALDMSEKERYFDIVTKK